MGNKKFILRILIPIAIIAIIILILTNLPIYGTYDISFKTRLYVSDDKVLLDSLMAKKTFKKTPTTFWSTLEITQPVIVKQITLKKLVYNDTTRYKVDYDEYPYIKEGEDKEINVVYKMLPKGSYKIILQVWKTEGSKTILQDTLYFDVTI